MLGRAAERRQPLLERGVLRLRLVEVLHDGEHHVGGARRQRLSRLGAAGLQHHRLALRRAADIDGSLDLEEDAPVVERPYPRRVEIGAAFAVGDDGVVGPAIPQPLHHVDELGRPLVAAGMVGMLGAEIVGALAARRGDGVPGRAALADMVERGEGARHRPGVVVGRRHRGAQPDMRGAGRERGQHGERLEPQRVRRMRAGIGIEIVAHEDEVEPAALGDARDLLHRREILEARHRPGMAPAGDMAAGAEDEQPQMHLTLHGRPSASRSASSIRRAPTVWTQLRVLSL